MENTGDTKGLPGKEAAHPGRKSGRKGSGIPAAYSKWEGNDEQLCTRTGPYRRDRDRPDYVTCFSSAGSASRLTFQLFR